MAFMARLRTAAGESPLALRITFMSWLRPVRRKCKRAAAVSAVAAARRGRNGGLLTLRAVSVKRQRAINSAHSRESACEEIGVAGAMLVIALSPTRTRACPSSGSLKAGRSRMNPTSAAGKGMRDSLPGTKLDRRLGAAGKGEYDESLSMGEAAEWSLSLPDQQLCRARKSAGTADWRKPSARWQPR